MALDSIYDLYRYSFHSAAVFRSWRDRQTLEARIFLEYHKLEKALSLPKVRPLFGLGYLGDLLDVLEKWDSLTNQSDATAFRAACAALISYRDHVRDALARENSELAARLDRFLANWEGKQICPELGGTIRLRGADLQRAVEAIDFETLVLSRHSVRNFSQRAVPDRELERAVGMAIQSPSVCNRQCWRVHVYTTPADKARVLQKQHGNEGFGHLADRVLLVTADLRTFVSSGERNQGYIDAGMFAMSLLYALESLGIASCCLNLSLSFYGDLAVRRACRIPASEIPVVMIVVGYPAEELDVAISARKPVGAILQFRDLQSDLSNRSLAP